MCTYNAMSSHTDHFKIQKRDLEESLRNACKIPASNTTYQSPHILTELFQHNLINVSYLTACYLYQVMMTLHFLNDVAYDAESTQTSKIRHDS